MAREIFVRVKYVGKKPFAVDNVAGSGKCWSGKGDVQSVTEEQAAKLAKFPDQWMVVGTRDQSEAESSVAVAALKELGADPALETPAADVAVAAAAIKSAVTGAKGRKGGKATKAEQAPAPASEPAAAATQSAPTDADPAAADNAPAADSIEPAAADGESSADTFQL